jgi:hypothetical protein
VMPPSISESSEIPKGKKLLPACGNRLRPAVHRATIYCARGVALRRLTWGYGEAADNPAGRRVRIPNLRETVSTTRAPDHPFQAKGGKPAMAKPQGAILDADPSSRDQNCTPNDTQDFDFTPSLERGLLPARLGEWP